MSGFSLARLFCTTPVSSPSSTAPSAPPAALPRAEARPTLSPVPTTDTLEPGPRRRGWDPVQSNAPRPPVVVLTGGPCGGKTSLLERACRPGALGDVQVFHLSEFATMAQGWGVGLRTSSLAEDRRLERDFVGAQSALESFVCGRTMTVANPLIICDRGVLDAAAFCGPGTWEHVLADHGVTEQQLAERYDFVLHVSSVAVDKPELYNNDNSARWETAAEAKAQDAKVLQAWARHPNRRVLGNDFIDFEAKMAEGMRLIAAFVRDHGCARNITTPAA